MKTQNFEEVAKKMYPQDRHMQILINPEWLANEIKYAGLGSPNHSDISVEYVEERRINVFVKDALVGQYGPVYDNNGKYVGDTLTAAK